MTGTLDLLLLKSKVIGSPLEGTAKRIRSALNFRFRWSHPELTELFLEEKRTSDILKRFLRPSSNVLDIGCHLGSFLISAKRMAPEGDHVAIEASPSKARLLQQKLRGVRIEQVAISDNAGTAIFEENISRPGFSRLRGQHPSTEPVIALEVPVTTIDALDLPRIDFMKIDIEGSELAAFRGGKEFIERNRPIILFECGADTNPGLDRKALFEHIRLAMRYDVFTLGDLLYDKGPLCFAEFRKCGIYPLRAFNFIALPN